MTYKLFKEDLDLDETVHTVTRGGETQEVIGFTAKDFATPTGTLYSDLVSELATLESLKVSFETAVADQVACLGSANSVPVVTIVGDPSPVLVVGDNYTDAGATALDAEDGDLTNAIVVIGAVDVSTAGTYTLTYTVTDSQGASDIKTRTVTVEAPVTHYYYKVALVNPNLTISIDEIAIVTGATNLIVGGALIQTGISNTYITADLANTLDNDPLTELTGQIGVVAGHNGFDYLIYDGIEELVNGITCTFKGVFYNSTTVQFQRGSSLVPITTEAQADAVAWENISATMTGDHGSYVTRTEVFTQ